MTISAYIDATLISIERITKKYGVQVNILPNGDIVAFRYSIPCDGNMINYDNDVIINSMLKKFYNHELKILCSQKFYI